MEFFKKGAVRMTAAVISALMAASAAFMAVDAEFEYSSLMRGEHEVSLVRKTDVRDDAAKQIDIISLMYAENTDGRGKIKGNKYFQESLSSAMKEAGVTDDVGKLIVPEKTDYYWQIKSGNNVLSNNADIMNKEKYEEYMHFFSPGGRSDVRGYTNGQGMYYYYDGSQGYAVYDYDTSVLESYTDDLGALIYLNSDGTTPVPCIYNTSEYESFDAENPRDNIELGYNVSICVVPSEEDIEKYKVFAAKEEAAESKAVGKAVTALVLLVVSALMMIYVVIMGGYDDADGKFRLRFRDRIPGEIFLAALIALPAGIFAAGPEVAEQFADFTSDYRLNPLAVKSVFTAALTLIYIFTAVSADTLLNRVKCHSVTDTFVVTSTAKKIHRKIRNGAGSIIALRDDAFTVRFAVRTATAVFSGIAGITICLLIADIPAAIPFIAVIILALYIYESLKDLKALNDLGRHITEISGGNYMPFATDTACVTHGMNEKLNCISDGIRTAVDEQIRSERMKIELVTNVSHDLKTPLTSVISYVDLLSKEELPPEARDYVAVLEQKTARLKTIVSDVFDLAKAAAGTDVNFETLDAVILMNQVLADMGDRTEKYEREIRTEINAENAFIRAEGKKMYRVLQNIFDNAVKYSMSGTRIFARLDASDGKVRISVKNTASYEMNFTPEEITERFTRGDKSRTTEGSGLGLSIAKSFTEACGGKFGVRIDGDVFAAEVEFDEI